MNIYRKAICAFLVVAMGTGAANQAVAEDHPHYSGPASPFLAAYLLIKSALAVHHVNAKAIAILSPAKNAILESKVLHKLEFNLKPASRSNQVKVYVDNEEIAVDRKINRCPCKIDLPKLEPGKHTITLKEATASQALTGVQGSVTVTVK